MDIIRTYSNNGGRMRSRLCYRAVPEVMWRSAAISESANGGLGGRGQNYNLCKEICALYL